MFDLLQSSSSILDERETHLNFRGTAWGIKSCLNKFFVVMIELKSLCFLIWYEGIIILISWKHTKFSLGSQIEWEIGHCRLINRIRDIWVKRYFWLMKSTWSIRSSPRLDWKSKRGPITELLLVMLVCFRISKLYFSID